MPTCSHCGETLSSYSLLCSHLVKCKSTPVVCRINRKEFGEKLFACCASNSLDNLKAFLHEQTESVATFEVVEGSQGKLHKRETALHAAVRNYNEKKHSLDVISFLLDQGIPVDTKYENYDQDHTIGCSQSSLACLTLGSCPLQAITLLLERKADPNFVSQHFSAGKEINNTPLHHTVEKFNLDATKLLLEHNADVNTEMETLYSQPRARVSGTPLIVLIRMHSRNAAFNDTLFPVLSLLLEYLLC